MFEEDLFNNNEFSKLYSKRSIVLSIFVIIIGLGMWYYFVGFGTVTKCDDMECYRENLLKCKKSWVINEDNNYVYRYEILKDNGDSYCDVDVILSRVINGVMDSQDLEGLNMVCKINKYDDSLPESDMLVCSGKLREELQEIIIERMHNQILQNLDQINEGFRS
jgi:galactitol-specific phosphotransferase system IIB component